MLSPFVSPAKLSILFRPVYIPGTAHGSLEGPAQTPMTSNGAPPARLALIKSTCPNTKIQSLYRELLEILEPVKWHMSGQGKAAVLKAVRMPQVSKLTMVFKTRLKSKQNLSDRFMSDV